MLHQIKVSLLYILILCALEESKKAKFEEGTCGQAFLAKVVNMLPSQCKLFNNLSRNSVSNHQHTQSNNPELRKPQFYAY